MVEPDPDEEWRTVGWAPNYEVSSTGRVRRTAPGPGTYVGKILALSTVRGYMQVNLSAAGRIVTRKVHILVCEAFHGPRPTVLHMVAHRDGQRGNNREGNLRWALPIENAADDLLNGARLMGDDHPMAKITYQDVLAIRRRHRKLILSLAEEYGVTRSHIGAIIRQATRRRR